MKEIKGSAVLIILTLALCCFFGGFLLGNIGGAQAEISTQQALTPTASTLGSQDSDNSVDDGSNGFPININTANLDGLTELPGIGETFAQRIIDYREQNGPFLSIEEIMKVSGIGESRFEDLKNYITVGDVAAMQTEPPTGDEDAPALININTAEAEELMSLPGIGETYAKQIIAYREENGPFASIEEIMKVSGIGESRFESLKELITVGDVAPTEAQDEEDESAGFPVNINTADLETLMTLPGIGETYAQRIIDYREENGAFSSIEEIMEVSGIGESRFENLKDYITVEDTPTATEATAESSEEAPALVNINTANLETLMTLPGIGETYAQRIIDYREENGAFSSIEEIMEVSGISESRFEKIKDYITVEDTE